MRDQDYMRRAIALAKRGRGWTSPNPLVGAVIVKDGRIIGEGFHERYGQPHAERNAIASLTESAQGATIYVTLEPCCHYGRTPPCTEAIIANGIARVVIGSRDPNPKVAGRGVALLREAGIAVEEDFLRSECDRLNPVFFHYITTQTPYVVLKYAMTADGKIATRTGASKWITGEEARNMVQQLRHNYRGIMAGIGTVLSDDPMLNVRFHGGRSPVRIICDSRLRLPADSAIAKSAHEYETIVACARAEPARRKALESLGIQVYELGNGQGRVDLGKLMQVLGERKIDSVLLEGGGTLNDSMLRLGYVHEVKAFVAPKLFGGEGAKTPVEGSGVELPQQAVKLVMERVTPVGEDLLIEYKAGV